MDRRDGAEEHLDGPLDDQPTLVGNLRDLRRLNRLSGGVALSRWGVNRLLDGTAEPSTLIDVGTGGADIPVALLADFGVAGTAPRGHGRRQPGRGAQRGARCPPEAGSRPAPAAGPRRPGAPAVPERDVRRRACVAGRASPRRGRGRPLPRGARPCQPAWDRHQRPAPRPPRIARGVARRPVPHPEPLHARRFAAVRPAGLDAPGGRGAAAPGRAGAGRSPHGSRSVSGTRWSRSRQPPSPQPPSRDGTGRRDRRRRAGRGNRRVAAGPRRPRRHRVRAKPGVPLASLRRVRVARHGRRAPPGRPG